MISDNELLEVKDFDENNVFHKSFEIGILLKGIDGVLEIIGGIIVIFINPYRLNKLVGLVMQYELSENPRNTIANFIVNSSLVYNLSTQHFAVFYLISHGIVKLILVIMLWKRKIFAYPLTIFSLVMFIVYQMYHYTYRHSPWLIGLTILDIIMIILTFIEYNNIKTKVYSMTSSCNTPPLKAGDNSDTSLDNSSKLGGSTTNSQQVRFIDE